MKKLFITFLVLAAFPVLLAAESEQAFERGNDAYRKGDYKAAIREYESVRQAGLENFALNFNLGNAYFKTEQIGKSIVSYERALRLEPADPDALYNLQFAQMYVVDKIVTPPPFFLSGFWHNLVNLLNLNQWATGVLLCYILLVAVIILRMFHQNETWRRLLGLTLWPVAIILCIALVFAFANWSQAAHKDAIILDPKASVYSSPADDATEVFALHQGCKVRLSERSGAYIKIMLADGKVGWIKGAALEVI
jgi:tetratricopeptide (TPR) repeat protein